MGVSPLVVPVDADAQIDLVGVVIRAKGGHQAENRIRGQAIESLEHRLGLHAARAARET